MNYDSKKIKRSAVAIITVIMMLVISICICVILYSNKLLPEGLHDYLRTQIEKDEREDVTSQTESNEIPFYEIEYELDLPKYKEIEILDLANADTMRFGSFSKNTINEISIIKADGKYGLISNFTGKILVEPTYDMLIKDFSADTKFESEIESIYGFKDGKYDIISLLSYKVKNDVQLPGHGGGSPYYYDINNNIIWGQEYETPVDYSLQETIINKYKEIGTQIGICEALNKIDLVEYTKKTYGYFDLETGNILIKPEFEKATLFQDGVAGVVKDGKAYYISEKNVRISEDYFEDVTGMHNFKAWIKQDGKWKLAKFPKIKERAKIYNGQEEKSKVTNTVTNTTTNIVTNTVTNVVANPVTNTTNNTVINTTNNQITNETKNTNN